MVKLQTDIEALNIVKDFCRTKMKGELFRNRLGNKVWPIAEKILGSLKWFGIGMIGVSLIGASGASLPALLTGTAIAAGSQNWCKGHIKYLQNLTLRNAALFGRSMRNMPISEAVRKRAMEYFIQRESPLFTAEKYMRKNPDMLSRLSRGLPAELNKNFVSLWDTNLNALASEGKKRKITWADRLSAYKKTFSQWRQSAFGEPTPPNIPEKTPPVLEPVLPPVIPHQPKESPVPSKRRSPLRLGEKLLQEIASRVASSLGPALPCGVINRRASHDELLLIKKSGERM